MLSQTARITLLGAVSATLLATGAFLMRVPDGAAASPPNPDSAAFVISKAAELRTVTATGQVVLFVDCPWNGDVVGFREPFREFAGWCRNETSIRPATVMLDADNQDALWQALQALWSNLRVSAGGLKNYGGAGRVVWFEDGVVRDIAWCHHLQDVAGIKERTRDVFVGLE